MKNVKKVYRKEGLCELIIDFYNNCAKIAAIYHTRLHYKDEYLTGSESVDYLEMIDSFENSRKDDEKRFNYYKGERDALSLCIQQLSMYFDIDVNFIEWDIEIPYEYNGKEYKLPIEYVEYSIANE